MREGVMGRKEVRCEGNERRGRVVREEREDMLGEKQEGRKLWMKYRVEGFQCYVS